MPGSVSQALECNAVCPAQKLLEPPPEAAINYFSICILRLQPWRVRGSPPGWGSLIQGRPPEERVPLSSLQIAWLPALIPCSPGQGPGGGGWTEWDNMAVPGELRETPKWGTVGHNVDPPSLGAKEEMWREKRSLTPRKRWVGGGQTGGQKSVSGADSLCACLLQARGLFIQYKYCLPLEGLRQRLPRTRVSPPATLGVQSHRGPPDAKGESLIRPNRAVEWQVGATSM